MREAMNHSGLLGFLSEQSLLLSCCLGALVLVQAGCSTRTLPANGAPSQPVRQALSPTEAAQLAAKLANEECEHLYRRRPFAADQHPAVLQDGQYRWGGLNVGGRGGYSALVVLGADGSHPKVEVYYSMDVWFP